MFQTDMSKTYMTVKKFSTFSGEVAVKDTEKAKDLEEKGQKLDELVKKLEESQSNLKQND